MAANTNVHLPDELLAQAQQIAQAEGKTADDIAAEAMRKLLIDRFWERNKQQSLERRGSMTDEQVEEYVNRLIHEYRAETRGQ